MSKTDLDFVDIEFSSLSHLTRDRIRLEMMREIDRTWERVHARVALAKEARFFGFLPIR